MARRAAPLEAGPLMDEANAATYETIRQKTPRDGCALPTKGAGLSVMAAATHFVRGNLGPGVLSLPAAFARAGWLYGTFVFFLAVAQGFYSITVLARCRLQFAGFGVKNVGDLTEKALGHVSRNIVEAFVFITQFGVCCVFMSLVAGAVEAALPPEYNPGKSWLVVLMLPAYMVLALLRFISEMTPLSHAGNVAMVTAVGTCTIYAFIFLCRSEQNGVSKWRSASMPENGWAALIQLAASATYAFEGIGLVIPIESSMREPTRFGESMAVASTILITAFVSLGLLGGVAFRGQLETGDIVSFLYQTASPDSRDRLVFGILNTVVALTVFVTFPLQLLPASDILAAWLKGSWLYPANDSNIRREGAESIADRDGDDSGQTSSIFLRLFLVVCCGLFVTLVPSLSLLVSLIGSVGSASLAMVGPICHIAMLRSEVIAWSWSVFIVDVLIVIFCGMIMTTGTYFTLSDMMHYST